MNKTKLFLFITAIAIGGAFASQPSSAAAMICKKISCNLNTGDCVGTDCTLEF